MQALLAKLLDTLKDPDKPGILSTDFWLTLLAVVLAFCVNVHVLTPADNGFFTAQLAEALPLVVKLGVIVFATAHYVRHRFLLKVSSPGTVLELPPDLADGIRQAMAARRHPGDSPLA